MAASKPSKDSHDCETTPLTDTTKDMPKSTFINIAQELHDQIYRELLLTNKTQAHSGEGYILSPAILRVCKQAQKESSRILYSRNGWVLIKIRGEHLHPITVNPAFRCYQKSKLNSLLLYSLYE